MRNQEEIKIELQKQDTEELIARNMNFFVAFPPFYVIFAA